MADIWLILRGQPGFDTLSAMTLPELLDWHALAADRAPKKEN